MDNLFWKGMVYIYSPCLDINENGHLAISGCDTTALVDQYGTPIYVVSEDEVRRICKSYAGSFKNTITETEDLYMPVRRLTVRRCAG